MPDNDLIENDDDSLEEGEEEVDPAFYANGGIIFSDGMEADFLRFTAGMEAIITVARAQGALVV